jgi:hypothetical protein
MFGENTALVIAWIGLGLGIINLVWNIGWNWFKFQAERRDRVRLSVGGPTGLGMTASNLGHVPRFFQSARFLWKEIDGPVLDRLFAYFGLAASYGAIELKDSSNSKEPTAVMDTKTFEFPLDRISELEDALKTKKKIGLMVSCRDGTFYWDFHGINRELLRMNLDWYKRGVFGSPPRKEEKPDKQPNGEAQSLPLPDTTKIDPKTKITPKESLADAEPLSKAVHSA